VSEPTPLYSIAASRVRVANPLPTPTSRRRLGFADTTTP
jgi:hypothetical protein